MNEFLIPSTCGSGGLRFYERSPVDPARPLDGFWVQVSNRNLSAAAKVYAPDEASHLVALFAEMASRWSGWPGELTWASLEGELVLRFRHDRLGHIAIHVDLWSGAMPDDWRVEATVMSEAGQLEKLARDAARFLGQIP
jgi:hypothetical protein